MEDNIIESFPFENIPKEQKDELVRGFIELTAKHAMQLFVSLGLKTHFESMVINEVTGEKYILSFKKITK